MAKVGAQRAAELTGKSKSTIQRAMKSGKISYEMDNNSRRVVDVAELERAFGLVPQESENQGRDAVQAELDKATRMLETERMKMRIKVLEEKLEAAESQVEDLREQRDQWQKQAQQVLLTSQHHQKEAQEIKEEMKERERRARERRQQQLEKRMKSMESHNENKPAGKSQKTGSPSQQESQSGNGSKKFDINNLWHKIKGDDSSKTATG